MKFMMQFGIIIIFGIKKVNMFLFLMKKKDYLWNKISMLMHTMNLMNMIIIITNLLRKKIMIGIVRSWKIIRKIMIGIVRSWKIFRKMKLKI
ncbi:hypothetical protein GLOIN_2v1490747 [Rhizophagus irregularis DAOM 181602=DAOM 197198]|uniref:Uncharacterized protein n=1 Tax=Rhizophagus irregularis (strain DAOM 181602 / DAOM 197198 / MUCL 43194) TaxID=747089 RepID=A0A2P4R025_RHIID|nr:hypothetical protein GLOIN_2v1490747 [Rhizophagus irregularis DAOM 181602=DAOM 197198]POG83260.1 hypothetical protein GLOIN_2v1490747 [Rhizophagus irregularis DAOM 181602=DAOM 197198]|eukprot:XP_025190126.1 hypothetical protein GLOIN_2v1490747 [Rhizophagus irregularis DAOM 181602=DAOM 197198]